MLKSNLDKNKIQYLVDENIDAYPKWKFKDRVNIGILINKFINNTREDLIENCTQNYTVCGRLMQKRIQGKVCFLDVKDFTGKIQIYANKKNMSEKSFYIVANANIGDFILVLGSLMKTRTGELTINASEVFHLSKSLISIPEHHHGLKNLEEIYRKKYLDLISNTNSINKAKLRMNIMKWIRDFFSSENYYEAETPILQTIYGGAFAKPFMTYHNSLKQDFYLRIATEIALKKLIVGGFDRVYEMGRLFRNEGISPVHNPEFTSLEAYCSYENLDYMKDLVKRLIQFLAKKININSYLIYDKNKITIDDSGWKTFKMNDIIKDKTQINFKAIKDLNVALELCKKHNITLLKHQHSIGIIMNLFFEKYVEKTLMNPTFITEYPIEISPFAKKIAGNEKFVERFELFINGREYANAFTEINSPFEQLKRFEFQKNQKKMGDTESDSLDMDFIEALSYGCPPFAGIGIGIDRLIMLLTNSKTIKEVILFPTLKVLDNEYKAN